jgi:hypothetical protein
VAIESVAQAGLRGLQEGLLRAEEAAGRIARGGSGGSATDIAAAALDLGQAELQAKASARVVETAERVVGSLIDVLA